MIIIPLILNSSQVFIVLIQFWVQDNFLKFKGNDEISFEKLCCETSKSDAIDTQMEECHSPENNKNEEDEIDEIQAK